MSYNKHKTAFKIFENKNFETDILFIMRFLKELFSKILKIS